MKTVLTTGISGICKSFVLSRCVRIPGKLLIFFVDSHNNYNITSYGGYGLSLWMLCVFFISRVGLIRYAKRANYTKLNYFVI